MTPRLRLKSSVEARSNRAINDRYGHHIGEGILNGVAVALKDAPDVRAYRLGGEEFVFLLRGNDVVAQAELCRQAIPAMVSTRFSV